MRYPVIVHFEDGKGYGVTVPDFPGCFTAGDSLEEALGKVQEAVELYMDGEELDLPLPTPFEQLQDHPDLSGGAIALVDLDIRFADQRAERVNVTVPRRALAMIDKAAEAEGSSRSAWLVESALKRIQAR